MPPSACADDVIANKQSFGAAWSEPSDIAIALHSILGQPNHYAEAKLSLDHLVDPSLDLLAASAELDRLSCCIGHVVAPDADELAALTAVRTVLYEPGPWNGGRPFAYDHSDPLGTAVRNKLLPNYLAGRRGNCVSMPILFLILAARAGLDVSLATAPHHLFVRFTARDGRVLNIEATSGGYPATDDHYRRNFPMTDQALENGLYMRSLDRTEGVAAMAGTVLEHLMEEHRYEEAIEVAEVIRRHHPRNVHALLYEATAYGILLVSLRPSNGAMTPGARQDLRLRRLFLAERNRSLFAAAESLGWRPEPQE